jgi:hypothetical protein
MNYDTTPQAGLQYPTPPLLTRHIKYRVLYSTKNYKVRAVLYTLFL